MLHTSHAAASDRRQQACCSADALVADILESFHCTCDPMSIVESIGPDEAVAVIRHLVEELEDLSQVAQRQAEIIRGNDTLIDAVMANPH